MANYVWTPFETMNTSALTLLGKIDSAKEALGNDLSKMNDSDVLYLFAHCNKFFPHIGDSVGNKLNAFEVGDKLVEKGLKKTHQCIKLWVCFAGYGMQHKQGFAYQFWDVMHRFYGFNDLTVFAYTDITVDPINDKHKVCYAQTTNGFMQLPGTAKDYRVGLRANGNFIPLGQS